MDFEKSFVPKTVFVVFICCCWAAKAQKSFRGKSFALRGGTTKTWSLIFGSVHLHVYIVLDAILA
ncbi:MAG: hypothetical protein ACKO86_01530, partial [Dolichospermum sp.]